jgi:hypothetical protein
MVKMKEEEIKILFGNKLVGTKKMKYFVMSVLSKMPEDVAKYVAKSTWFLGSFDDAWAFTFTGNDLAGKHMVFISDDLLNQHAAQIRYTIAHEIGHVVLGHRNSVFEKQSKSEIAKQEKEADEFAKEYL